MRKNTLIEKLQALKGNPQVVLWNGFVQDYVDIGDMVTFPLYKMSLPHYIEVCRLEHCRDISDWSYQHTEERLEYLKRKYKEVVDWEDNPYVTDEDLKAGKYTLKTVFVIDAKTKGKKARDRMGSIEY